VGFAFPVCFYVATFVDGFGVVVVGILLLAVGHLLFEGTFADVHCCFVCHGCVGWEVEMYFRVRCGSEVKVWGLMRCGGYAEES